MRNLRRIGQTLYVRFTIPKDRWADCGKREEVRTLQTRDLKEARKRRDTALAAIRADLNAQLAGRGLRPLDSEWVPDWASEAERDRLRLAQADNTDGGLEPDGSYIPSSRDILEAGIEDRAEALEAISGPKVSASYYRAATGDLTSIGPLAERWLKDAEARLAQQTIGHHRFAVNLFGTFLARDRAASDAATVLKTTGMDDITPDQASAFIEWLETDQKKHPTTIARIHSPLSTLWKWAVKRRLAKENVWAGLASSMKRKAKRKAVKEGSGKRPYTEAELIKLLQADPNAGRRWTFGAAIFDTIRLGLLTGARLNEICSLRRVDIIRDGTGMRVDHSAAKTDNSVREIPLHALAQRVIKDRLRDLPATDDPEAPLFPELPPAGPDRKRSWKLPSKFSIWRKEVLGDDDTVDFHSFRRCFATHFEMAQGAGASACTDLVLKDLMGHARGSVTGGYVSKDLGWQKYTDAIDAMVAHGLPPTVLKALEETAGLRPALPRKPQRSRQALQAPAPAKRRYTRRPLPGTMAASALPAAKDH